MKEFRLIRTRPEGAVYNMALDEKIFTHYLKDRVPVFRVYLWKGPSFTYGFSQCPDDLLDLKKCLSYKVEAAKRMTGGGIIFHNDEITHYKHSFSFDWPDLESFIFLMCFRYIKLHSISCISASLLESNRESHLSHWYFLNFLTIFLLLYSNKLSITNNTFQLPGWIKPPTFFAVVPFFHHLSPCNLSL